MFSIVVKRCECVHLPVCPHASAIAESVDRIIERRFGGIPECWDDVWAFVRKNCQYRTPKAAELGTDKQPAQPAVQNVRLFSQSIPAKDGYCVFRKYLDYLEQQASAQ